MQEEESAAHACQDECAAQAPVGREDEDSDRVVLWRLRCRRCGSNEFDLDVRLACRVCGYSMPISLPAGP